MKKVLMLTALTVAMSSAYAEQPTTLNFCTGGEGGFYESLGEAIGKTIVKGTPIQANVLNTGGSVENSERMKAGTCDIAIVQADAAITQPLPTDIKVVDAHSEMVYWLHGDKGVDDFGKMEKDSVAEKYALATVSGSGALVTLRNWTETDADYKGVVIVEFDDWYAAAEAVSQGYVKKAGVTVEIAGMIYITRPGKITTDITEDFGEQIRIGEVNDDSFGSALDANGNPLYTHCEVGRDDTSGMKTSTALAPDTYCMRAQVVYNNEWHNQAGGKEGKKLRRSVDKGINSIVKAVR